MTSLLFIYCRVELPHQEQHRQLLNLEILLMSLEEDTWYYYLIIIVNLIIMKNCLIQYCSALKYHVQVTHRYIKIQITLSINL